MRHNEEKIREILGHSYMLAGEIRSEEKAVSINLANIAMKEYGSYMYQKAIEDYKKENYGNPTYYETIVKSDIWKEWTQYAEDNMLFDMAESIECGWLSDNHWEAFINWVRTNENKHTAS